MTRTGEGILIGRTDEWSDVDIQAVVEDDRVEETFARAAHAARMRHCPDRYDFGVRYLDRDLPD